MSKEMDFNLMECSECSSLLSLLKPFPSMLGTYGFCPNKNCKLHRLIKSVRETE